CRPPARPRIRGALPPLRAAARAEGHRSLLFPRAGARAPGLSRLPAGGLCGHAADVRRPAGAGCGAGARRAPRARARTRAHMIHRAMVLAAGRGTRLAPATDRLPEPLMPVARRPML